MASPMTNEAIGEIIGCTHSMASRLRAGKRLPSVALMKSIHTELGVPWDKLVDAHQAGPEAFGRLFREALAKRVTSKTA